MIGGSAFISVIREAPGIVNHVGEGSVIIGHWREEASHRAVLEEEAVSDGSGDPQKSIENLANAFTRSGIKAIVADNIRQVKWEKLLWNIVFNPVTALTRTTVGEVLDDPDLAALMEQIKDEFLATAQAAGVSIHPEMIDIALHPDPSVRRHKTSMLQDLENGRKMGTGGHPWFYNSRGTSLSSPGCHDRNHLSPAAV
ncbi:ketopantoate reductase C-terminal domain-containing protein [Terrilactibacillus sp. S3-3]|nr:ketopantoate reductase C-terminal domain-containing protein [Terrilactibacillus sp. S3-3]